MFWHPYRISVPDQWKISFEADIVQWQNCEGCERLAEISVNKSFIYCVI